MNIPEVTKIVQELNDEIESGPQGGETFFLELRSDGIDCSVDFLGSTVWDMSEDLKGEGEPLKNYLKNQCNNMIECLQEQKFKVKE
jgi:hypothetical protein